MQIDTRSIPLKVVRGTNSAAGSITEPVPTLTAPAGPTGADGVIPMGESFGEECANSLKLIPYGTGSSGNTYTMKVYQWDVVPPQRSTIGGQPLWVPTLLASFTITLGNVTGVAGTDVNASQLFSTTITLIAGNANVSNEIISPGSNVLSHIIVDAKGAQFVEIRTAVVSATDTNCLYKQL